MEAGDRNPPEAETHEGDPPPVRTLSPGDTRAHPASAPQLCQIWAPGGFCSATSSDPACPHHRTPPLGAPLARVRAGGIPIPSQPDLSLHCPRAGLPMNRTLSSVHLLLDKRLKGSVPVSAQNPPHCELTYLASSVHAHTPARTQATS